MSPTEGEKNGCPHPGGQTHAVPEAAAAGDELRAGGLTERGEKR